MKYNFVKKGSEISSQEIQSLMDFEQLLDKAAGASAAAGAGAGASTGTSSVSGSALATKGAFLTKAAWFLTLPATLAVYVVYDAVTHKEQEMEPVENTEIVEQEASPQTTITVIDSANLVPVQQPIQPTQTQASAVVPVQEEEEETPKVADDEPKEPEERLIKEDIVIKAEPIGGFDAFYETIDSELTYPENARMSGIEGYVQVYFIVDKEGKAGKFRVVRSLGKNFDTEALRVMRKLTEWSPAQHNGQTVSSHMSIRLRFELENQ